MLHTLKKKLVEKFTFLLLNLFYNTTLMGA